MQLLGFAYEMKAMKTILTFAVLLLSASASAQGTRIDCKLLGILEGTKLWAGECIAKEPTRNEARNEMRRAARRTKALRPVQPPPPPPAEEKSWWNFR
jgi:hypothetical protein